MRRSIQLAPLALALGLLGCPPAGVQQTSPVPGATTEGGSDAQTPVATPVALPPFDRATAKTPWGKAKVGAYCVYKQYEPKEQLLKFEIVEVTDSTVSWVRKDGESGATMGSPIKEDLAERESKYKAPETIDALAEPLSTQTMDVGGQSLEVQVMKRAHGGNNTESWLSGELPPFMEGGGGQATVRSVRDGTLMFELIEFGLGE